MFENLKRLKNNQKSTEELQKKFENVEFEKNDKYALFIAAFITFVPVILVILAVFFGIVWFFFGA
ncbi:MAG: hypothetical protein ACRCZJ_02270 [Erysipelotrichaceae bacterium]